MDSFGELITLFAGTQGSQLSSGVGGPTNAGFGFQYQAINVPPHARTQRYAQVSSFNHPSIILPYIEIVRRTVPTGIDYAYIELQAGYWTGIWQINIAAGTLGDAARLLIAPAIPFPLVPASLNMNFQVFTADNCVGGTCMYQANGIISVGT